MRTLLTVLLLLALPLGVLTSASAGTTMDPDLTDPCGEAQLGTEPVAGVPVSHLIPDLDIRSAWISDAPVNGTLLIGLRTCGEIVVENPQDRVMGRLSVHWVNDTCRQSVSFADHEGNPAIPADSALFTSDGPGCGHDLTFEVAADRVGDTVTWTLPRDGTLGAATPTLLPPLRERRILTQLRGDTSYDVGGTIIPGDETGYGRAVILTR